MSKKALLVGINYKGTGHDLRGCINDVNNVSAFLATQGFEIVTLTEKEATTQAILAALRLLVSDAKNGDILYFHFSGHGSQIYSKLEEDKLDEIICPYDLDWKTKVITDNDLKEIFNSVPVGVNTTIVLDCCHSGDALDQGESMKIDDEFFNTDLPAGTVLKAKVMTKTMKQRYLPMPADIQQDIQERSLSLRTWNTSRDINKSALLIAGCRSDQTSADATINGQAQGAATASMLGFLKNNPSMSYRDLVTCMNGFMIKNKFTQRPVLDGSSMLYDHAFLQEWQTATDDLPTESTEPTIPDPVQVEEPVFIDEPSPNEMKNKLGAIVALGVTICVLAIIFL